MRTTRASMSTSPRRSSPASDAGLSATSSGGGSAAIAIVPEAPGLAVPHQLLVVTANGPDLDLARLVRPDAREVDPGEIAVVTDEIDNWHEGDVFARAVGAGGSIENIERLGRGHERLAFRAPRFGARRFYTHRPSTLTLECSKVCSEMGSRRFDTLPPVLATRPQCPSNRIPRASPYRIHDTPILCAEKNDLFAIQRSR